MVVRRILIGLVVALLVVGVASCAIYAVTQPPSIRHSVVGVTPQG